jgi:N-acetylmuramoyl-L-alanine amidase
MALLLAASLPACAYDYVSLQIETHRDRDHVILRFNDRVDAHVFRVDNPPPRVVVDMPSAHWDDKAGLPHSYNGSLITRVRLGYHTANTSRMVFDLSGDVSVRNVRLRKFSDTSMLQFDIMRRGAAPAKSLVAKPHASKNIARTEPQEVPPAKPMIVIDAGHGGQDPGTSGRDGAEEKNFTLRYAKALRDALLATGRYNVFLTRTDDRYLFLRERVARARAAKGNLFISLHADSAPTREAQGLSVYTISETASDKEAAALAAKENKADVIGGMDLSDTSDDVADILIDLTQRETRAKSARFADLIIKDLGPEVSLLSNTHRFAGFAVLKAPDIPSVLVEIGFLTTPSEEHTLATPVHQAKVVHGMVKAINAYFGE